MPIDQAFLDGLTGVPKVGPDGVNAPEEEQEAKSAEPASAEVPKAESEKAAGAEPAKEQEAEEVDPYKLLDALFEEAPQPKPAVKASEQPKVPEKAAEKAAEKKDEVKFDSSFLPQTDEDFDKILASRANFLDFQNKLLSSMHNFYEAKIQGVLAQMPTFQQKAVEEAMQRAAQFVPQHVQEQLSLQKMVDEFYQNNPDLLPIRRLVGQVANKIQSIHPDWSYDKIFEETGKQANKLASALNIPQAQKPNGSSKQKPAFAKAPGGRKPAADKTQLQKDIDMLIS